MPVRWFWTLTALLGVAGPRISVLGDSYSTYEGVIPPGNAIWYLKAPRNRNDVTKAEECWWTQVVKNLGGTLERNESWSGSTICNTNYGGKGELFCGRWTLSEVDQD